MLLLIGLDVISVVVIVVIVFIILVVDCAGCFCDCVGCLSYHHVVIVLDGVGVVRLCDCAQII